MSYSAGSPLGGPDGTTRTKLDPPPSILADNIDVQTGDFASIFTGRDPIDAQVIEAVRRIRGSGAAVQDDGNRFMDIEKIDENTAILIDSEARFCLRRLIDRGDITFISVTPLVYEDLNAAEVEITYINNRSADPKPKRVRVRQPEA